MRHTALLSRGPGIAQAVHGNVKPLLKALLDKSYPQTAAIGGRLKAAERLQMGG